jgi:cell division protein FtsW
VLMAVGLTLIQPDLGTALLIMGASFITIVIAGVDWRQLLLVFCLLAVFGGAAMLCDTDKYQYAAQRIQTWLNPMANEDSAAYQITQARGALAVGGVFGRGYLRSDQKINRLPLSTKDFVYPVMVEELGYVGGVAIILLFLGVAWAGLGLSQCCRDHFNRTAIASLCFAVCMQGLVNIGVSIGTLPLSGLTLPYFSEGGTSVVVTCEALGLALALALSEMRQARRERLQPALRN